MKRLLILVFTLLLLVLPVSADILWEPYDNSYYINHTDEMTSIDQCYVVPDGMTVNIYTAPQNGTLLETLEAGTQVYVGFSTVVGGETWGVGYANYKNEGWFRLGRLQREYTHADFLTDYADSIVSTEEAISVTELNGTVYTWTWPGSGVVDRTLSFDGGNSSYNEGKLSFSPIYTDPDGGRWGYIGYYMGHCGWAYLDDLTNPDPDLRLYPEVENTVTDTAPEKASTTGSVLWIVILVAGVTIGTGAAITLLKKRRNSQ